MKTFYFALSESHPVCSHIGVIVASNMIEFNRKIGLMLMSHFDCDVSHDHVDFDTVVEFHGDTYNFTATLAGDPIPAEISIQETYLY